MFSYFNYILTESKWNNSENLPLVRVRFLKPCRKEDSFYVICSAFTLERTSDLQIQSAVVVVVVILCKIRLE